MNNYSFDWKYKDFEIRTTPSIIGGEPYIELLKWDKTESGKEYCFTLAYWYKDDEGYELHFVGDRPLEYISELNISEIWKQLFLAQQMLQDAWSKSNEE